MSIFKKMVSIFIISSMLLFCYTPVSVQATPAVAPYIVDLVVSEILEALGVTASGAVIAEYGKKLKEKLFDCIPGSDYFSLDESGNVVVDYGAILTDDNFLEDFIKMTADLQGSSATLDFVIDPVPISYGAPIEIRDFDFSVSDYQFIAYADKPFEKGGYVNLEIAITIDNKTEVAKRKYSYNPGSTFSLYVEQSTMYEKNDRRILVFSEAKQDGTVVNSYVAGFSPNTPISVTFLKDDSVCLDVVNLPGTKESVCVDFPKAIINNLSSDGVADVIGGMGTRSYSNAYGADLLGIPEVDALGNSWAENIGQLTGVPTDVWSRDVTGTKDTTWEDVKEKVKEKEVSKEKEAEKDTSLEVPFEGVKDNEIDFSPLMVVTKKFPFSIPWDVVYLVELFNVDKECPTFKFEKIALNALGGNFTIPGFEVNFEKDVPGWHLILSVEKFFICLFYTMFMVTKIRDFMKS